METRLRTLAKSLTWRVTAFFITTSLVWLLTKKVELAASVASLDAICKFIAYYGHERLWLKNSFGKLTPVSEKSQSSTR